MKVFASIGRGHAVEADWQKHHGSSTDHQLWLGCQWQQANCNLGYPNKHAGNPW